MQFFVEHIGLAAQDPVTLKDWYVRVLAAKVVFEVAQAPPAFFLELPGGVRIEIYQSDTSLTETSNNRLAGWRHLALKVNSIDAARTELARHNIKFDEPPKPAGGGGRILFFKDTEGNLLHLVERPAESPLS